MAPPFGKADEITAGASNALAVRVSEIRHAIFPNSWSPDGLLTMNGLYIVQDGADGKIIPCFFDKWCREIMADRLGVDPNALQSIGPGHAEDMLGHIAQNQIGGDRGDLVEAAFAEFPLDVIFLGETETAMGLQTSFRSRPSGIG